MERENDYEQGQKPTTYRKLENFINCYPLTVKINDDMRRGRFIETDFKGKSTLHHRLHLIML